jgi:CRP-like cAMP-binding protein
LGAASIDDTSRGDSGEPARPKEIPAGCKRLQYASPNRSSQPKECEMVASRRASDPHTNRLLDFLRPRDSKRLRPHLHRVALKYRQFLSRANKPIEFVYFIETGVGSLVNTMENGDAAEVGTIGNEGVVGLPLLLGDDRAPMDVYVQVPGTGLRMKATIFNRELARSASMRAVMLRYAHAFFNQVAQSAACNQFHSLEQRCCRWLLMTHDRVPSSDFLLTQEFLAMMLGVQRTGVTIAARALQRAGLIRYKRGNVTILDRRGLMRRSCECYGVSKREFDRLLGGRPIRITRSLRV